ncbi:MAG: hypothetical protein ACRDOU_25265 [Streptosporangiaceae bacterium]
MTCPLPRMQLHTCQADGACCRPPRFQARLEAANGTESVLKNSEACVDHLGDMVQDLTAWARVHHVTEGQLTVLAIDRPSDRSLSPDGTDHEGPDMLSLAFSTIRLAE